MSSLDRPKAKGLVIHEEERASLRSHRSRDEMMQKAHHMSAAIDQLAAKAESHPPHYPAGMEALKRKINPWQASLPKVTRSYEVAQNIIKNVRLISGRLDSRRASKLSESQHREIGDLIILAGDKYSKGFRNRDHSDDRPSKEIESELKINRQIDLRLDQWAKYLGGEGELPAIDRTLAQLLDRTASFPLISQFEERFPASAELLRTSLPAMLLVRDADKDGVTFAGYAEDGPLPTSRTAYQKGGHVYITRNSTDPAETMEFFLFELSNAMNRSRIREIAKKASKGQIGEEEFIYSMQSIETEASLKSGEIWSQMGEKGNIWQKRVQTYQDYQAGNVSLYELASRALQDPVDESRTHEQFYRETYNKLRAHPGTS